MALRLDHLLPLFSYMKYGSRYHFPVTCSFVTPWSLAQCWRPSGETILMRACTFINSFFLVIALSLFLSVTLLQYQSDTKITYMYIHFREALSRKVADFTFSLFPSLMADGQAFVFISNSRLSLFTALV